jgi:hypothetical protein
MFEHLSTSAVSELQLSRQPSPDPLTSGVDDGSGAGSLPYDIGHVRVTSLRLSPSVDAPLSRRRGRARPATHTAPRRVCHTTLRSGSGSSIPGRCSSSRSLVGSSVVM